MDARSPHGIEGSWDDTPAADQVPLVPWVGNFAPRACRYTCDFGDDWVHDVVVRGLVESDDRFYRCLVGGDRLFPPEDRGSLPGFEGILEFRRTSVLPDGEDELDERLGDWQPEADMADLKKAFDATRKPRRPA